MRAQPYWFAERPGSIDEWRARVESVRSSLPDGWWRALEAAGSPSGAARERLTRVVEGGGALVTTGQQPGLFGGPVYTWSKAMTALALADGIEAATGVPMAPVFWAATDDDDFAEAAGTWVSMPGGARHLELSAPDGDARPLATTSLGDVSALLAVLDEACGSGADARPLAMVRRAYSADQTVGGAYVALLRAMLGPMGVVVLDASHPAVSEAAHPILTRALERSRDIERSLMLREEEVRAAGFAPQVELVAGRSLVFDKRSGARVRVTHNQASATRQSAGPGSLSPNVLLRPVVERAILPTVAYAAGPGELAYFAQVSAVADALEAAVPLALPRWSVTIIEPHVARLLERYEVRPTDLANGDALATALARGAWPDVLERDFRSLQESVRERIDSLRTALGGSGLTPLVPLSTVDGLERGLFWRLGRLERRITAGIKRHEEKLMQDLGTLRGALYPGGVRQERALNLIPIMARHGLTVLEGMREAAREHAQALVRGEATAPAEP